MAFTTFPSKYPLNCVPDVYISVRIQSSPAGYIHRLCVFRMRAENVFSPELRAVQIHHHWRHQPGLVSWGKTVGITRSLSLSLTQILFPLHSREKNWHSSCPTLGGFKGAVIQQMKCRESSAESRGTNPITIHLSETVNCTGWDKILSELWLTKLNEPLTSNIWLCCVNITWPQLKTIITFDHRSCLFAHTICVIVAHNSL